MKGRDSPGVGTYSYEFDKLANTSLSESLRGADYSFGTGPKIQEYKTN